MTYGSNVRVASLCSGGPAPEHVERAIRVRYRSTTLFLALPRTSAYAVRGLFWLTLQAAAPTGWAWSVSCDADRGEDRVADL